MIVKEKTKSKGINLYDVLPVFKPSKAKSKAKQEYIDEYDEIKNSFVSLQESLFNHFGSSETGSILSKAFDNKDVSKKLFNIRSKFLTKFNYLPDNMLSEFKLSNYSRNSSYIEYSKDSLTNLSQSPKIKGSDVKNLVDKFGFIAIPVECLNPKSYENEEYNIQREIRSFEKNLSNYNVYVITPIEYYSLEKHVYKNTSEKGIYAGKNGMVFTSVVINIPMFRSMLNTISSLNNGVQKLESENIQIKQSISQIDNTLKNLQRQVDIQQTQIIQQQLVAKQQAEELQRFEEMSLRVIDPVMIAFDKNIDINSDSFDEACCFVGPCWGPDFDEAVSLALDLKIIKNQRSNLTKTSAELWN
jgi:hypothetical protein